MLDRHRPARRRRPQARLADHRRRQRPQPTGLTENERGEPIALADRPAADEPRDCLELRLFTEITDGIDARGVAETIEAELDRAARRRGRLDRSRAALVGPVQLRARRDDRTPGRPGRGSPRARRGGRRRLALLPRRRLALRPLVERHDDEDAVFSCPRSGAPRSPSCPGGALGGGPRRSGRLVDVRLPRGAPSSPEEPDAGARHGAGRRRSPEVPWRCGVVSRNSGRFGCANCGHSAPSGSGSSPDASTTASFSSAFSVQTE